VLFQRTYGVAILVGLILGGLITIQVFSMLDVGGVSEVVRPPERGTGTRCAEGDEEACQDLCVALSDVSTLRCVQQLSRVFPAVEGGGGSSGTSPPSSGGGGPSAAPPGPPAEPPSASQKPPAPKPSPNPDRPGPGPPGPPGGGPGPLPSPDRVCERVPALCDVLILRPLG